LKISLPADLRAGILAAARAAYPGECCGLVVGVLDLDRAQITALHPARNLSDDPDRFDIDPTDHIVAQKSARATGHAVIGCYHSHPDGQARPSATDMAGAGQDNFLWLIAAGEELAAFVYLRGRFTGAEWVTSDS
jgi:proteasome lid subunit RPN8/RPN11